MALPDAPRFRDWYATVVAGSTSSIANPAAREGALKARAEVAEFLEPIIQERKRNPGNDLLSDLAIAEFEGQPIPHDEIVANLKEVGVRVRLRVLDWSLFLPQVVERRFQLALWGESGLADPDDFLFEPLHSRGGQNVGSFSDGELDKLLEAGRRTADDGERRRIYAAAQHRILDAAPHVFLFQDRKSVV